jgi:hypothetical protein
MQGLETARYRRNRIASWPATIRRGLEALERLVVSIQERSTMRNLLEVELSVCGYAALDAA